MTNRRCGGRLRLLKPTHKKTPERFIMKHPGKSNVTCLGVWRDQLAAAAATPVPIGQDTPVPPRPQ